MNVKELKILFRNEQEAAIENKFPGSYRKVFHEKGVDKSVF